MTDFFRCVLAFFKRDAQLAVSYPIAFALGLLKTLGRVVALWLPAQLLQGSHLFEGHGGFLSYAVIGTSIMGFFMASYGVTSSAIRAEQSMGTLESVLMTRANVASILGGSAAWAMTRSLLDTVLMLGAAMLVYGLHFAGSPAGALFVALLTNLSFLGLGMCSAAFILVFKRGDPIGPLVSGASYLMGGVVYPIDVFPEWLRWIAELLPITHGVRALRGILLDGRSVWEFIPELIALCFFALLTLGAGLLVFDRALRKAQIEGSLLQY